jgi:hypothetical protein
MAFSPLDEFEAQQPNYNSNEAVMEALGQAKNTRNIPQ